ncbi:hypothetical protein [Bradyrhizobium japonicum]|uniref:hypothetical protein n=1 Tax=Bradyrhizobium japonicum TaxID=375 RepID=UPI000484A3DD|nr:hypothetical protein [Bradyrhizobium japonicum]
MEYLYLQFDQSFRRNSCRGAFASAGFRFGLEARSRFSAAAVHGVVLQICIGSISAKADIAVTLAGCNKQDLARSQMTF